MTTVDLAEDAKISKKKPDLIPVEFKNKGSLRTSSRAYKFVKKLIFPLNVKEVENLTIFAYTYLDPKQIRNAFPDIKMEDVLSNTIRSKIRFLDIKQNGRYLLSIIPPTTASPNPSLPPGRGPVGTLQTSTTGPAFTPPPGFSPSGGTLQPGTTSSPASGTPIYNVRHEEIYKRILSVFSDKLYSLITFGSNSRNIIYNSWTSQMNPSMTSTILGIDYYNLVRQNSFITSMVNLAIYRSAKIKYLNVRKIDPYDETRENLVVETQDNEERVIKKIAIRKEKEDGEIGNISYFEELPFNSTNNRFFKLVDMHEGYKSYYYEVELGVEDPTIKMLAIMCNNFNKALQDNIVLFDEIKTTRSSSSVVPKRLVDKCFELNKKTISKMLKIVSALAPSAIYDKNEIIKYLSFLSNPKATSDDHETYLKVLHTFYSTLSSLLSGSKTLSQEDETTPDRNKVKAEYVKQYFFKTEIVKASSIGIEFLIPSIAQEINSLTGPLLTKQNLITRGKQEVLKFWNDDLKNEQRVNTSQILEKATFNLTPIKVYGPGNEVIFNPTDTFDERLETKINDTRLLLSDKPTGNGKDKPSIESLDDVLFSIQSVGNDYDLSKELPSYSSSKTKKNAKRSSINTPIQQDNFLRIDDLDDKQRIPLSFEKNGLSSTFDALLESGYSTLLSKDSMTNEALEQILATVPVEKLPPSYQSFVLKEQTNSKFSNLERFEKLSSPENHTFISNFMNVTAKIQVASIENLYNVKWEDLNFSNLDVSKIMLCRLLLINDDQLGIDNTKFENKIYNYYFLIGQRGTVNLPNNIRTLSGQMDMEENLNTNEQSVVQITQTVEAATSKPISTPMQFISV